MDHVADQIFLLGHLSLQQCSVFNLKQAFYPAFFINVRGLVRNFRPFQYGGLFDVPQKFEKVASTVIRLGEKIIHRIRGYR